MAAKTSIDMEQNYVTVILRIENSLKRWRYSRRQVSLWKLCAVTRLLLDPQHTEGTIKDILAVILVYNHV